MTPERWQQVKDIFDRAVECDPASRTAFIHERCGNDQELQREVESLLASDLETGSLLDNPLIGPPAAPPASLANGDSFGPYVPVRVLGEGGMGTVYLARQQQPIRREVALKVVKLGMDSRQVLERFEIERQALALMDYPNVARVLDAGTSQRGRPYFVMEYVDGAPITQYCDRHALSTRERLQLFIPVCNALQHAHKKGIIHRDVKPSNVLVTEIDGKPVPKVIDFGVARATDQRSAQADAFTLAGQLIGTPEYMSPEQASLDNRDIDTGTDVYSLGMVLYELLVGALPLDMKALRKIAFAEVLRAIRETPVPKPTARITQMGAAAEGMARHRSTDPGQLRRDLSGDLDWIVMKAIDKDRHCRYASASEFAADIERFLKSEPVLAGPPGAAYRMRKFAARHKRPVAALAAVVLALVAGIITTTWQAHVAGQQRAAAIGEKAEAEKQRVRAEQQAIEAAKQRDAAQAASKLAVEESGRANESSRLALARQLAVEASQLALESPANNSLSALLSIESMARQPSLLSNQVLNRLLSVTPKQVYALDHSGASDLQFSHGGQWIAAASDDKTVRILEAITGREVSQLAHGGKVLTLAFSPNDHWIATGSLDQIARVFEASTGKEISRLAHEGAVVSVAFSPAGGWVATAGSDKTARVFEAATGNEVSRVVHQNRVSTVAFSPDGRWIATSSDDGTARVLEAATGKEISRRRFQTPVLRVKFSPDGHRIAATDVRTIVVFEAATGNEISQISLNYHEYQEDAIAFSPDGRWIADAGSMARVIDANTGQEISHLRHDDFVTAVVFSPDGRWVATASADHTSRIFEAATGREISVLPHPSPVLKVAFSPDGRLLATGSGQPNHTAARVFEVVAKEKEIAPLDEDRAVVGTAFIANARLLATISRDGFTRIFDVSTGKEFTRLGQRERQAWPISPDGRLFAARDNRRTGIYEVATGKEVSLLTNEGTAFAFSPDGRRVATIGEKGNAQIFESDTGRKISDALYPYNPNIMNRSLLVLAFSPNGRWVANGPFVVEAATGRVISEYSEGRSYNPANRLSFSPDNRLVARGNYSNNTVQVLEAATGKEILSVAHRGTVQAVAFSPNGRWIATGSADKTARVFLPLLAPALLLHVEF